MTWYERMNQPVDGPPDKGHGAPRSIRFNSENYKDEIFIWKKDYGYIHVDEIGEDGENNE